MGTIQEKIADYIRASGRDTQDRAQLQRLELPYHMLSYNTRISYERDLQKLAAYLAEQGIVDVAQITKLHLTSYVHLIEQGNKHAATAARAVAAIKAWFRYLSQTDGLVQNPAAELKAPRVEKKVPQILTPEEVARLLQQPAGDSPKAVRDRAMLELLYATGIRVSELVQLKVEDVNLGMEYILCQGEKRERVVPFGKTAKAALQVYLDTARTAFVKDVSCRLLFTNMSGQQMSRQGFWKMIGQYGRAAGIQGKITPHMLRHSFAAHLVNNGADLYAVQELMGYTDLSAAQVYAKMNRPSIREVYTNTHPRK